MKNKKYLSLFGIGCGLFLLTGCGGSAHTLKCSTDMSDQLMGMGTMKAEVEIEYNKEETEAKKATMTMDVEITNDAITDEMMDQLKEQLESEQCSDDKFDSCTVTRKGKKLTVKATGSADAAGFESEGATLEEAKKEAENAGFTCK